MDPLRGEGRGGGVGGGVVDRTRTRNKAVTKKVQHLTAGKTDLSMAVSLVTSCAQNPAVLSIV